MGYSHGKKWTFEKVKEEVLKISADSGIMPSFKTMDLETGSKGLSVAVSRYGGHKKVAEKLGLEIKKCETNFGRDYEMMCLFEIENRFGYVVDQMGVRHPYDLLVENVVKIDVKASHLVKNRNGEYFTFNLEKKAPTCDIFICYCIDDERIKKTYIIPSGVIAGKSQLSIGINKSIYDNFLNQWHYVKDYADFFKGVCFEQ